MENEEPSLDNEICEQLEKLEGDTDLTAASNFAVAQRWERWNMVLGLGIVILSGVSSAIGAFASSGNTTEIARYNLIIGSTVLASTTAILGSILTFLKPSEIAARYREFGNKQKSLRNKTRLLRTVSITFLDQLSARHDALIKFLEEKETLNSDNPPIPRWAFKQATRDIADKQARRQSKKLQQA